ncbi:pirin family protein [Beggiatoa leptomitoformis]|uniref:Quercetin 2,3-dioxygenase n=1 Tax=Beggiatoa leptomitoformis TaxID=288004 RepID=A0A2N9YG85_9GAMM|nr:pirin family protein [Beggiatoa leptomitoformis]ALG68202.1 quercetin 2,3-dioxygenase [Beggiatoa leptomitoformis]AUI69493.1 quercetin 2,3-dioxygenase [Beggiatoa leptomitoformis]
MLSLRPAHERGHANHGWLDTYHSFSFADYYDTQHMQFGALRVINEDTVTPAAGFPTHGHSNMEIITYILAGELAHRDSMGNTAVIRKGEVQRMSAGTGITHSEYNASQQDPVHLLQIWIKPNQLNLTPSYEQKVFSVANQAGELVLVGSPDGRMGSVTIHQDVLLYAACLDATQKIQIALTPNRRFYLHIAQGELTANGHLLQSGDALMIEAETALQLVANAHSEILLFDLA